jgi:hypothetical protein
MEKIKSYSKIWNLDRVFYSVGDVKLPMPISGNFAIWSTILFVIMATFGKLLSPLIPNKAVRIVVIPIAVAWIMSKKTFDGKKPLSFLKSVIAYWFRNKTTCMGKQVKTKQCKLRKDIPMVRSELYVPDKIY